MTIRKSLAALTAGLMLSSLAIAPAFAHRVKSNVDSASITVTATVAEYCTFASDSGQNANFVYNPQTQVTTGTNTFSLQYSCNGGATNPYIGFTDTPGGVGRAWDCVASGSGSDTLSYYISGAGGGTGPNGAFGCNGTAGYTGSPIDGSSSVLGFTLNVDPAGGPYQADTYTDTITAALTP
jgi:hypothetical protein